MKPNAAVREVTSGGVAASNEFGISRADETHIMTILRDTLYSNKILAVLREYSANAWDANREAGREDVPIKITLATAEDPTLYIRDFGPGISPDNIFRIYTQYGSSTKREDDNSVGCLGIGSKSAFCYSDSFTITSWYEGWKRTYVAVLDASDKGVMNLLHEESCDFEESGVQIQVAVRPGDIDDFNQEARSLFKYFIPRPDINIDLPDIAEEQVVTDHGLIWREAYWSRTVREDSWTAVMGCVPYRVDIRQILDKEIQGHSVGNYIKQLSGVLYFQIGEVQINASREGLKYSDKTRLALIQKLNYIVDEYVRDTLVKIQKNTTTIWEQRLQAQVLNELGLPVPEELKNLVLDKVKIPDSALFVIGRAATTDAEKSTAVEHISVRRDTRLLLRDEQRQYAGYQINHSVDYVVRKNPSVDLSWDQIECELAEFIRHCQLEGIPIIRLSTLPWSNTRPGVKRPKAYNKRYQVRSFRFTPAKRFDTPLSQYWEPEVREPQDSDVFVILHGFKAPEYEFYSYYKNDLRLAEEFDVTLPTVYGYKYTEKKPIRVGMCKGTEYSAWRVGFAQSLATPEVIEELILEDWAKDNNSAKRVVRKLVAELGGKHPITRFYGKQMAAARSIGKRPVDRVRALSNLRKRVTFESTYAKASADILERYPLFETLHCYFDTLCRDERAKLWYDYIKLIDRTIPVAAEKPAAQEEETVP